MAAHAYEAASTLPPLPPLQLDLPSLPPPGFGAPRVTLDQQMRPPATVDDRTLALPAAGLRYGAATHVGLVRERNEDAYAVLEELGLAIVADGMGGHNGGAEAAHFAVETVAAHVAAIGLHGPPSVEQLALACRAANARIHGAAGSEPELAGMGTTVAAVWAHGCRAVIAHVGDSRIYQLRGGVLTRLTDDHTVAAEWLRAGVFGAAEAARSQFRHALTRAIGLHPEVEVTTRVVALQRGDRLLLCSDGLTDGVPDEDIARVLEHHGEAQDAARTLMKRALVAGGRDNVTAVLLDVAGCPAFSA